MPLRFLGVLAMVFVVGCGASDHDPYEMDPGVPEGPDISGTWIDTYVTEAGTLDVPRELGGGLFATFVHEDRQWTVTGHGAADGSFVISGVPEDARFLLQVYAPEVGAYLSLYTAERQLQLGRHRSGRPNATSTEGEPLEVDVEGMSPWTEGDSLLGSSYASDGGTLAFGGSLEPGQTEADDLDAMWFTGDVPEAAQGDVVHWSQQRGSSPVPGVVVRSLVAHGVSADLTLAPGEPGDFAVSLTEVDADRPASWDIRASELASRAEAQPLVKAEELFLSVYATPESRFLDTMGNLVVHGVNRQGRGDTDLEVETTYGDPYPSEWGRVVTLSQRLSAHLEVDGEPLSSPLMFDNMTLPLELALDAPLRPRLGAPRNLRIDGVSCAEPVVIGSDEPMLSWEPSDLGTPVLYEVHSWKAAGTTIVAGGVVVTDVPEAPLRLEVGSTYAFTVVAHASPDLSASAPRERPLPVDMATAVTNLVTVESSDDGGESP